MIDNKPRIALFIDAENVAPANAGEAMEIARSLGSVRIARCYGNEEALRGWRDATVKHHLMPKLTPPASGKQNASDFALTIEAVSLLHRELFDVALIVSSDADFAPLALYIRESGKIICCIGDHKKLKPNYRTLFDRVFDFTPKRKAAAKVEPPAPVKHPPLPNKPEIPTADLIQHFKEYQKGTRKVTVASFGRYVGNRLPQGYRKGYGTVTDYLKASGAFDIGKDNSIKLKEG